MKHRFSEVIKIVNTLQKKNTGVLIRAFDPNSRPEGKGSVQLNDCLLLWAVIRFMPHKREEI